MQLSRLVQLSNQRIKTSGRELLYRQTGLDYTRPLFIRCTLTERCNYRCGYCYHWRQDRYASEMSFVDWTRALISLRDFVHPLVVQFLGGEPFVWPHFLDLVESCRDHDINWGVITNGSAFNPGVVKRLVEAKPVNVDVSVDAADSAVHNKARGISGSLERIELGIGRLIQERDRLGIPFLLRIKCTVHSLNYQNLGALVDWTMRIGASSIDFSPVRLWREEDKRQLSLRTDEELRLLEKSVRGLLARKHSGQPIETSISKLLGIVGHFKGEMVQHGAPGCRAGLRDYLIGADGDVRVCDCFSPIGNVKQNTAAEIWQSASARQARQKSLTCETYTSQEVATSCLAHRSLLQDFRRGLRLFGR
jgi:radical SAM protein with 4Fe4S-binding SPASM domain